MPLPAYNVRKAAQVVAFFAKKQGGSINVLKLAKLVYLADREFMSRYDCPILYDQLVSMEHGPVNSRTLNYINGCLTDERNWDSLLVDREGHTVGLRNPQLSTDDLDELSEAEVEVLEDVWSQFSSMDRYALRDYTHEHCPEWEDPDGSSSPIPYERVFKFLGKRHSAELQEMIETQRALDRSLCQAS